MAHAEPFFPGGLKFNIASDENNHNNGKKKKSILNVSLDAWCATTPDKTVYFFSPTALSFHRSRKAEAIDTAAG